MPWNISALDQLVYLSRRHGYRSYLKVPCTHPLEAEPRARGGSRPPRRNTGRGTSAANDMDPRWSAWYLPLAAPELPFVPTQFYAAGGGHT